MAKRKEPLMKRFFAVLKAATLVLGSATFHTVAQTLPDVRIAGQIAEPQSLAPYTVAATNDFRILVNIYTVWSANT